MKVYTLFILSTLLFFIQRRFIKILKEECTKFKIINPDK